MRTKAHACRVKGCPNKRSGTELVLTEPAPEEPLYRWRVRARLPERLGAICRVLARGRMNTCEVEFLDDGYRVYTSRNYLQRAR